MTRGRIICPACGREVADTGCSFCVRCTLAREIERLEGECAEMWRRMPFEERARCRRDDPYVTNSLAAGCPSRDLVALRRRRDALRKRRAAYARILGGGR